MSTILLVSLANTAYVVLIGIGIAAIAYFLYRRWTRSRVVLFIFSKNRHLYRRTARPDKSNVLKVGAKSYIYSEDRVLLTSSGFLRESSPCLVYAEGRPSAVNLFGRTPQDGITDSELSDIMNDDTIRDFVSAQGNVQPRQIRDLVLGTAILLAVAVGGSAYLILNKLAELASDS